jgi:hypothetical protein
MGGPWLEASPGKQFVRLISQTIAKWTGGVAQGTECLLSKCETPSSNPSRTTTKFLTLQSFYHEKKLLGITFVLSIL